jgi:hypothetical protein
MSAVAHIEAVPAGDGLPSLDAQAHEEHRWLVWVGTPMAVGAGFLAISFATGRPWILTFTFLALIADLFILLWLVSTTDTNEGSPEPTASGH